MAQWYLYCKTESQMVSLWGDMGTTPLLCPNDPTHTITNGSAYIKRLARVGLCNGTITRTNSETYVPLMNYITQGSDISNYDSTLPIFIKVVASVDFGSYDFSFVTVPDEVTIYESLGHSNIVPQIITIPIANITNIPPFETSVDIRFRTSGGTVTVRNISVYYGILPS